jgi:D-glycero-D-manno-heptose 1,7-bisphosphate phosphatase
VKQLIILDRDGVINFESKDFIKSAEEFTPIPGSLEAIAKLNQAGFIVCVATNQSGVGRQLFTEETLSNIHNKMRKLLSEVGGKIDDILYCPHLPNENCLCRKPLPGMILELLSKFQVAPQNTYVIGDSLRDLQAGEAAGCKAILVKTGNGTRTLSEHLELKEGLVFDNLDQTANYLLSLTHQ